MINRPRWWLVVLALLASAVVAAATPTATAGEIRDKAGLFSPEAVQKSLTELDRLEKEYEVPMTIETVESLNGETVAEVTTKHAQAVNARGIYLLIAKKESKILAEASRDYRKFLTREKLQSVDNAFAEQFKKRDFDAGLARGMAKMGSVLSDAKLEAGGTIRQAPVAKTRRGGAVAPVRQAPANKSSWGGFSLFSIILGILGVWLVIRLLSGLMGALRGNSMNAGGGMMGGRGGYPGQGGPGYGGGGYGGAPAGGGGFMSSMFGGIGGALAGNYLYDQFSGRNHGGGVVDQTGVDAGAGAAPIEDAGPEWGVGGAEADYGGTTTDNSGGGDWGGGGGGDWGGGGGDAGGDWGGGGGGDAGGDW